MSHNSTYSAREFMCILAHKPKISQQVEKQTKYCESTIGKLSTNCQWMSVSLASHMVACQLAVLIGQKYLQTLLIEDAPGPSHPSLTQWTQAQIDCPLAPSLSLSLSASKPSSSTMHVSTLQKHPIEPKPPSFGSGSDPPKQRCYCRPVAT